MITVIIVFLLLAIGLICGLVYLKKKQYEKSMALSMIVGVISVVAPLFISAFYIFSTSPPNREVYKWAFYGLAIIAAVVFVVSCVFIKQYEKTHPYKKPKTIMQRFDELEMQIEELRQMLENKKTSESPNDEPGESSEPVL